MCCSECSRYVQRAQAMALLMGTGSNAPKVENVAIGNNAKIGYSSGASAATGDIVVGKDANINNYASQGGSIAIGKNAKIEKYGRRCRG